MTYQGKVPIINGGFILTILLLVYAYGGRGLLVLEPVVQRTCYESLI